MPSAVLASRCHVGMKIFRLYVRQPYYCMSLVVVMMIECLLCRNSPQKEERNGAGHWQAFTVLLSGNTSIHKLQLTHLLLGANSELDSLFI